MDGLSSMHSGPCPRVAIITRTKDRPMFLKRAINSVLGQTFEDWQHVIVNDGGAPHDIEALVAESSTAYRGRVLLIHHPLSRGMEAAANEGIKASSSDYLVIHDDDDSWAPTFLDRCVAFMEAPPAVLATPIRGVATYSTKMIEKVAEGKFIQVASEPFNTWMSAVSLYRMAANNSIPPISFLFERSALEAVGLYREELPVLGDWEFHLRFLAQYEIGLIKEELAYYHHRLDVKDGVLGNTVIAQRETHLRYDQLIRNDLLRRDLALQQVGLGFLVNLAQSFETLNRSLGFFSGFYHRVKGLRGLRWLYFKVMGSR